mgnify:FL=1
MELAKEYTEFLLATLDSKLKFLEQKNHSHQRALEEINFSITQTRESLQELGCDVQAQEPEISKPISQSFQQFIFLKQQQKNQSTSPDLTSNTQPNFLQDMAMNVNNELVTAKEDLDNSNSKDTLSLNESHVIFTHYSYKSVNSSTLSEKNPRYSNNLENQIATDQYGLPEDDSFLLLEAQLKEKALLLEQKLAKRTNPAPIQPTHLVGTKQYSNNFEKENIKKKMLNDRNSIRNRSSHTSTKSEVPNLRLYPRPTSTQKSTTPKKEVEVPAKQSKNPLKKALIANSNGKTGQQKLTSLYTDFKPTQFEDKYLPFSQRNGNSRADPLKIVIPSETTEEGQDRAATVRNNKNYSISPGRLSTGFESTRPRGVTTPSAINSSLPMTFGRKKLAKSSERVLPWSQTPTHRTPGWVGLTSNGQ